MTTDVILRDAKGRFIPDLTKDSITVLEDGVAQKFESFASSTAAERSMLLQRGHIPRPKALCCPPRRGVPASEHSARVFLETSQGPGDLRQRAHVAL